jgi:hypothetical protein
MKAEKLLNQWQQLPEDKQQAVIDFVEFLTAQLSQAPPKPLNSSESPSLPNNLETPSPQFKTPLAQKLWAIRQKGIATGEVKLLDWEGIEKEMEERRGVRTWND